LCCLSFCLLVIVLSVLLSFGHCVVCPSSVFTDSDYPLGIFKLFIIGCSSKGRSESNKKKKKYIIRLF
jgi:hypothetical protein